MYQGLPSSHVDFDKKHSARLLADKGLYGAQESALFTRRWAVLM